MDKIDARILSELQKNGRLRWSRLSERVHLSASACQRRVEALRASGVIRNFTLNLSEAALGHHVTAFVAVSVDRQNTASAEQFRRWVRSQPRVQACHMLTGSIDFMLQVVASDLESLGRFLEAELLNLPAVKDASTSIVLNEVKAKQTMLTAG